MSDTAFGALIAALLIGSVIGIVAITSYDAGKLDTIEPRYDLYQQYYLCSRETGENERCERELFDSLNQLNK